MKNRTYSKSGFTVLDAALLLGIFLVFTAVAVPLVRGAMLKHHAAECAGKILQAADAFDLYAAAMGYYPPDQKKPNDPCDEMNGFFALLDIDWWGDETDVGGRWEWDYMDHFERSIAICRPQASRRQMEELDAMIDDGDLLTGTFQRWGAKYHYILKR